MVEPFQSSLNKIGSNLAQKIWAQVESLERSDEIITGHLQLLHIKVKMEGLVINRILVDGGAAINLLPESMMSLFQKIVKDLIKTNMAVIEFS
ncbi:hypothetical protein HN51_022990, partial [Arachis hypogaea]